MSDTLSQLNVTVTQLVLPKQLVYVDIVVCKFGILTTTIVLIKGEGGNVVFKVIIKFVNLMVEYEEEFLYKSLHLVLRSHRVHKT